MDTSRSTVWRFSVLLGDRVYDAGKLRAATASKGRSPTSRPPQRVRQPAFRPFLNRYRYLIERFFNKLNHFRAAATRYYKHDDNFFASVQRASSRIWLRHIDTAALRPCNDRPRFVESVPDIRRLSASGARPTNRARGAVRWSSRNGRILPSLPRWMDHQLGSTVCPRMLKAQKNRGEATLGRESLVPKLHAILSIHTTPLDR